MAKRETFGRLTMIMHVVSDYDLFLEGKSRIRESRAGSVLAIRFLTTGSDRKYSKLAW